MEYSGKKLQLTLIVFVLTSGFLLVSWLSGERPVLGESFLPDSVSLEAKKNFETVVNGVIICTMVFFIIIEWLVPFNKTPSSKSHFIKDILSFFYAFIFSGLANYLYLVSRESLGIERFEWQVSGVGMVFAVLLIMLLDDFLLYWIHRAMHSDLMWKTHKWHHSPIKLTWLSGFRGSWVHVMLMALPNFVVISLVGAGAEVIFTVLVLQVIYQFYVHANININLGIFTKVFVTPQSHRIHHGKGMQNKNLAFYFTLFDRMFGTWVDPDTVTKEYPLGLNEKDSIRMTLGF